MMRRLVLVLGVVVAVIAGSIMSNNKAVSSSVLEGEKKIVNIYCNIETFISSLR